MEKKELSDVADLIFSFRPDEAFTKEEVIAQMREWNAEVREFKCGEKCVEAGSPTTHFLMVLEGVLHRRLPTSLGDDILVGAVSPGDYACVSTIFSRAKALHTVDVVAGTDALVVFFDVARVRASRTDPKLVPLFDYLASVVCDHLQAARTQALVLSGMNIAERLRRYISVRMSKGASRTIVVPGNEADFAKYLCVNKCALSRVFGQLRAAGKMEYRRNVIKVRNWIV